MNRTDRLYALVEELRAARSGYRTSAELAEKFEVTTRTIERDILALQESGVPIYSQPGRRGGYAIDSAHTLPPLNFSPAEATAIAVALARETDGPFTDAGVSARRKIVAAMSVTDAEAARQLTNRIRLVQESSGTSVSASLQEAIENHAVVSMRYRAADATVSTRVVEPVGLVTRDRFWYLVAWCRLREDHRSFRLDRIEEVEPTGETAPERDLDDLITDIQGTLSQVHLF